MHAAFVIDLGRRLHIGDVMDIPDICGLVVPLRIAHAADGAGGRLVAQLPGRFFPFRFRVHSLADHALRIAHRLIEGAVVIDISVVGRHRVCHTVCEFVRDDVDALGEIVDRARRKCLPSVIFPAVAGVVDADVPVIAVIVENHDRRSLVVAADPADLLVVVVRAAVIVKRQEADLVPFPVVRTGFQHHFSFIDKGIAVPDDDLALQIAEIIHARASVAHHRNRDLLLASVSHVHVSRIIHGLHELKDIFRIIACVAGAVVRRDRRDAVEILTGHRHKVHPVRQGRLLIIILGFKRIVGIDGPHISRRRVITRQIDLQHARQDNLLRPLRHHLECLMMLLRVRFHGLRGLFRRERSLRFVRKILLHGAAESEHVAFRVRDHLGRAAGHGIAVVDLLEDIVLIALGIREDVPGIK